MDEGYEDDFEDGPHNDATTSHSVNSRSELESPAIPKRPPGTKPTRSTPHRSTVSNVDAAADPLVSLALADDAEEPDDDGQDVRCQLCTEPYEAPPSELRTPRVLRCFHTICSGCCSSLATERTELTAPEITCPLCSDLTEVPRHGGIQALPLNFAAVKLVKQRVLTGQQQPCCGLCGDTGASAFCVDCQELICSKCVDMHAKVKTFQGHVVTSLDGAKNTQHFAAPQPMCPHHNDLELDLWCETCQQPICRDCIVKIHKDHKYVFVAEAAQVHKEEISAALKDADSRKKEAQGAIEGVDHVRKALKEREQILTAEVTKRFDDAIAALAQRKGTLLQGIKHTVAGKTELLDGQKALLVTTRERFDVARHMARQTLEHGTDAETVVWLGHIMDRTHEIARETYQREPVETEQLECNDNVPDLLATLEKWMVLQQSGTAAYKSIAKGTGITEARCFQPTEFIICTMDSNGNPRDVGGDTVAVDFRVQTAGLQAWHDDEAFPCASQMITDEEDGTYTIRYEPHAEGLAWVHINVNGHPIRCSPFSLAVVSAFSLPPFYRTSKGTVEVEAEGRAVRVTGGTGYHVATTAAPLPAQGVSFWKVVIHQLKDNNWLLLGMIGDGNPAESSYMHPSMYGWACNSDVFVGGKNHSGDGGWQGFEQGDEVLFMHDPKEQRLVMTIPRLFHRRFVLETGPTPPQGFFLHANLSAPGDRVELRAAAGSESAALAAATAAAAASVGRSTSFSFMGEEREA